MPPATASPVRLRHHGDIEPVGPGERLVSVSVGPYGEAIALWSDVAGAEALRSVEVQRGWATFPNAQPPRPMAARITTHWPELGQAVPIAELPVAFPTPQPLPDGGLLVVGARCRWRTAGPDRNAVVYDADGAPVHDATLGDGIEHVYTTPSGEVWVGYFDEGVFGNYGWAGPGPSPIGASGIVHFGQDLAPLWSFPSNTSMADCYALNVASDAVWACYYTDFPVARVAAGSVRTWVNVAARGVKALTVLGNRCALIGGYQDRHAAVVVGELGGEAFQAREETVLVLPDGDPLPRAARLVARGPELHAFVASSWYRADL